MLCKHSFYRILEDYETKEELDTLIDIHGPENIKLILYFKFGTNASHCTVSHYNTFLRNGK